MDNEGSQSIASVDASVEEDEVSEESVHIAEVVPVPPRRRIRFEDKHRTVKKRVPRKVQKKIQVRPNISLKHVLLNPLAKNYLTSIPVIEDSEDYVPILYTFRVPTCNVSSCFKSLITRSPPFWLQLDHTIAVIWSLFSEVVNNNLGISQLHWALMFLSTIYKRSGECPKDVEFCMEVIGDNLLAAYAELSNEITKIDDMQSLMNQELALGEEPKPEVVVEKIPFSLNYTELIPKQRVLEQSEIQISEDFCTLDEASYLEVLNTIGANSIRQLDHRGSQKAITYLENMLELVRSRQAEDDTKVTAIERVLASLNDYKTSLPRTITQT